jgi:anti-sigma factor RsiW
MNCRYAHRHLSAFQDGELSPRRAAAVRLHLDRCPDCRGRLDALRDLRFSLAALDSPAPPAGLAGRILQAAQDRRPLSPLHRFPAPEWLRPSWELRVAGVAAAILCALAGAWLGSRLALQPSAAPVPVAARQVSSADPLQPIYSEPFRLLPSGAPGTEYLTLMEEGRR